MVDDMQVFVSKTAGGPTEHMGPMKVDTIPHDLGDESADFLPACSPKKPDLAGDHLVNHAFLNEAGARWGKNLTARRAKSRVGFHFPDDVFEIVVSKGDVAVELADVDIILCGERLVTRVKRFHDAAANLANTSVLSVYNMYPWMFSRSGVGDLACSIG